MMACEPELYFENESRMPMIGMALFALPVFGMLTWIFFPVGWAAHPFFAVLFALASVGLLLTLWALYSLLPKRPVLATYPEGVFLGLWVRRGVPWRNVREIRLTGMRMTGGLKKRWSAGRPYDQELVVDVTAPDDLLFENGLHRFAHRFTLSRGRVSMKMKLVSRQGNDAVLEALRSRWLQATRETADEEASPSDRPA